MPSSNQQAARRRYACCHWLVEGGLLPLARPLSTARLERLGKPKAVVQSGARWTNQQALRLRKRYPLWGKRKLWKALSMDRGLGLSLSRVGRILAWLVRLKQARPAAGQARTPPPVPTPCQAPAARHARQAAWQCLNLNHIDHMSAGLPAGFAVKEFKAACPVTGFVALKAYSRATSRNAKDFLAHLIEPAPFKIRSIQVDGGSGFRDELGQARQALDLPLLALPPERNGCVERANGASRYEFYPLHEGPLTATAINQELVHYRRTCNHCRPRDSLNLMAPMAHYQQLTLAA